MENSGTDKIFLKFFFVYIGFLVLGAVAAFGIVKEQFLTKDRITTDDIYTGI